MSFSLHVELARTTTCMYKDTISYAKCFSSQFRDKAWHLINRLIDWSPNDVLSGKRSVTDWRGCVVQAGADKIPEQLTASDIITLGIPLLFSNKIPDKDERSEHHYITAAYYPFCSMTKAQLGASFTYTENTMNIFVLQTTFSSYTSHDISAGCSAATEARKNGVTNSQKLLNKFLSAFHQTLNSRNQIVRN